VRSGHSARVTGWLCTGMSAVGRRFGGLTAGLDTVRG
jgi:hypothetical protein